MSRTKSSIQKIIVISISLSLLGVAGTPITNAATNAEQVTLTFETGPDGEAWEDPSDTDFGYVDFDVYTPHNDRESPATAQHVPTPDQPPSARNVITNLNSRGESGWLNIRFRRRQSNPQIVLWLEPKDEQIDRYGNSNKLLVRGYDSSNNRVYDEQSQITAGGYVREEIQPSDPSDHISRVAITVLPPSGSGHSRFYVGRIGFNAEPPKVDLTVSPTRPDTGDQISIRSNIETAGEITEYEWVVDDERQPAGDRPQILRPNLGTGSHTVSITVTDRLGLQGTTSKTFTVERNREPPDGPDTPNGPDWWEVVGGGIVGFITLIGFVTIIILMARRVRG